MDFCVILLLISSGKINFRNLNFKNELTEITILLFWIKLLLLIKTEI